MPKPYQEDVVLDPRLKDDWSIQKIWNDSLTFAQAERVYEPRQHIWASEIGKEMHGRYLKMLGTKPEVPYSERVLRKFEAGNMLERHVGFFLVIAGILQEDNKRFEIPECDEHLAISGRPDFQAGGIPKPWKDIISDPMVQMMFRLMPSMEHIGENLHKYFVSQYSGGLKELVYEVKSVNSMLFWAKKDYLQDAYHHHQLQLFTYLKALNKPEGRMLYISKDDLTLVEFPVYLNDEKLEKEWQEDIEKISKHVRSKIEPELPPSIIFDQRKKITFTRDKTKFKTKGAWTSNWQVEWSQYFPTVTGCKDVDEWTSKIKPELKDLNDEHKAKYIQHLQDTDILDENEKVIAKKKSETKAKKKKLDKLSGAIEDLKSSL